MRVAGRVAEQPPRRQYENTTGEQGLDVLMILQPSHCEVQIPESGDHRFLHGHREEELNYCYDCRQNKQQFDRGITNLPLAADVVAHQIPGTPKQLPEGVDGRTGFDTPQLPESLPKGKPTDTTVAGGLGTYRTIITLEGVPAVVAHVLGLIHPIDFRILLPGPERLPLCAYELCYLHLSFVICVVYGTKVLLFFDLCKDLMEKVERMRE